MQNIVIERPYRFIPPHRGWIWPTAIQQLRLIDLWLRRKHGVVAYECRNVARLVESLRARHGILLAPNHCRPCDPIVLGWLARSARTMLFAMASWHLYHQGWLQAFAIRKMGAFSVYREGLDRQAIQTAIEILASAERPLVIFPEGAVTRTNDRLNPLLEGVSFIARSAAKKRAARAADAQVVVHPVALKYRLLGDLQTAVEAPLADIERRLTWKVNRDWPLIHRIGKIGMALLALKEMEHLGQTYHDPLAVRLRRLVDHLLHPLEQEWLGATYSGAAVPRVKTLRMKIVPDLARGELPEVERQRRWQQLEHIYLAQQLDSYPEDYLLTHPSVDRILETVERFVEDLTDEVPRLAPLRVIIDVGAAIAVSPERDRTHSEDPTLQAIEGCLSEMLARLALESPTYKADSESTEVNVRS